MTNQEQKRAADLIARLHSALEAARVSATVRIVDDVNGPKLHIASAARGEELRRLNIAVTAVLRGAGAEHRYLGMLEQQN